MTLHVLASNMKRMMRILGVAGLMEEIRVFKTDPRRPTRASRL